jgi:predicted alpha/beta hydrolase family esterase
MAPAEYLILHGLEGSGPGHWQRWLAGRLPSAAFPDLPDPALPRRAPWLTALRAELDAARDPIVVCHSLACVLWLHHAATRPADGPRARRVLLVAPPCACAGVAEIEDFFPVARDPRAVAAAAMGETRLVCAEDDPYCPEGALRAYAEPLGCPADLVAGGGHLNPDAGYGPWPALEAWVRGERPNVTG